LIIQGPFTSPLSTVQNWRVSTFSFVSVSRSYQWDLFPGDWAGQGWAGLRAVGSSERRKSLTF